MDGLYIGLMSGTSLDGIDGVLADPAPGGRTLAHCHRPFSAHWRGELLALNRPGPDELHRAALAANAVAHDYAAVVQALLAAAGVPPRQVRALGAHGQTVRHKPDAASGAYTLQLLNGALLAELTAIDVVCDFRSRDVAAGGEGAPLVPAFHADRFAEAGRDVALLNLGGIANLTLLPASGGVTGFDVGPANVLMDGWCRQHTGQQFDDAGAWAAGGRVDPALLARLLAEPYFGRQPPKSTGRDLFHAEWLGAHLPAGTALQPRDVMATLAELTARSVADALLSHAPNTSVLRVCGGGAFNAHLMARLTALLPALRVETTAACGVPPEQVEALAFAWLAAAFVGRRAGNLPAVTGARGPRVLGALYPAGAGR